MPFIYCAFKPQALFAGGRGGMVIKTDMPPAKEVGEGGTSLHSGISLSSPEMEMMDRYVSFRHSHSAYVFVCLYATLFLPLPSLLGGTSPLTKKAQAYICIRKRQKNWGQWGTCLPIILISIKIFTELWQ